jgi:hypothetical protein
MPFSPGVSGNPNGRPPKSADQIAAERLAARYSEKTLAAFGAMVMDKDFTLRARVTAANLVLEAMREMLASLLQRRRN